MDIYIDSANVAEIKSALWFPIRGITTNPTIVARERKPFIALFQELLDLGLAEIHAQVLGTTAVEIVKEAEVLVDLAPDRIIPKIPVNPAGLGAIMELADQGYRTTATGIYTVAQGVLAARAGAKFLAPYINRIDGVGGSGCSVASQMKEALTQYNLPTQIIAASVKTTNQLQDLMVGGVDSVTITGEFLHQVVTHGETEQAIATFLKHWGKTYETLTLNSPLRR
jgi:fructose-6-phosphate aldolase 2